MGRLQMRATVQTYLQGLELPYVGTVKAARDYVSETDYDTALGALVAGVPAGENYGCVLIINIPDDTRTRKAMTGRGQVQDWNIHKVALEILFANTSGDPMPTQLAYDALIDAIFIGVRKDPLLGNPSVVWSAAEFDSGISHTQSEPFTVEEGMAVFIHGVVRFDAYEWEAGQNV